MPGWDDAERAYLVALLRQPPPGWTWSALATEVVEFGRASSVWHRLHQPELLDGSDDPAEVRRAARDIERWRAAGVGFHTFPDSTYPAQLREIHDLPPVLFSCGSLVPGERAASVVGSRRASASGLRHAGEIAEALIGAGITVVSGLAEGIDSAAHLAALRAGGRTVAVIGTGVDRVFPPANRALQDRIVREGLVLSQFWPDAGPSRHGFPLRNATMSGYGCATVIVEAGEHSGARIQARVAVEHGRAVVLTESALGANDWAKRLQHRPGVYVAASTDDVLAVVAEVSRSLDDVVAGLLRDGSW